MSDTEINQTPITIDGVEHILEDLAPEQQAAIRHISSLDSKMAQAKFDIEQYEFAKGAFTRALIEHMNKSDEVDEEVTSEVVEEPVAVTE